MKSQVQRIRTVGLAVIGVLFLISVLQLTQSSAAPAQSTSEPCGQAAKPACNRPPPGGEERIALWRGLAMASLYLGFCLRPRRRGCNESRYAIDR